MISRILYARHEVQPQTIPTYDVLVHATDLISRTLIYLYIYSTTFGLVIGFMVIIRYSMYCKYFYDKVMARNPINSHSWIQLAGNYRQKIVKVLS